MSTVASSGKLTRRRTRTAIAAFVCAAREHRLARLPSARPRRPRTARRTRRPASRCRARSRARSRTRAGPGACASRRRTPARAGGGPSGAASRSAVHCSDPQSASLMHASPCVSPEPPPLHAASASAAASTWMRDQRRREAPARCTKPSPHSTRLLQVVCGTARACAVWRARPIRRDSSALTSRLKP